MATLNFPDEPTTGDIYTDSNSGFTYEWNGTVWISSDPSTASNIREIDDISSDFDGSDTTFTLKVAGVNVEPVNVQQLIISVGGVMQNAGDDYTVSGSTLTFTTPPDSGLTFFGTLLGTALSLNTVANGTVGSAALKTEDFTIGGSGNTVTIPGNLTVQGTETIINTERLDIQDKTVGIASTNAPTSTSQDDAGIVIYGQTQITALYDVDKAALGISTNVNVAGFVTATGLRSLGVTTCGAGLSLADSVKAQFGDSGDLKIYHNGTHSYVANTTGDLKIDSDDIKIRDADENAYIKCLHDAEVELYYADSKKLQTSGIGVTVLGTMVSTAATIGSGVTINNTGIDAGIGAGIITAKTYYGDATNMTGAGSTFQVLTVSPYQGEEIASGTPLSQDIIIGFNHAISAGNADKNITLKTGSATGPTVQTFDVDSDVTYSYSQARLNPTSPLDLEETYFVVADEGAVMKVGTATSSPVINGYSFTTADAYHDLFTFGINQYGNLGLNSAGEGAPSRSSPTQVGTDQTWGPRASMDSGNSAQYMTNIKVNGTLWSWGRNNTGALGLNQAHLANVSSPTQVGTNTNWANITQGSEGATIAVKTDGTLWSWGQNKSGGMGQNNQGDGTNCNSSPTQIGTGTDWSTYHLGCMYEGFSGLKTDGTLWMFGSNYNGQMGLNSGPGGGQLRYSSPVQVGTDTTWDQMSRGSDGTNCNYATKTDGTLWSWGRGDYGMLGQNSETYLSSPTQVGTDTNWALIAHDFADENNVALATKTDGTLWSWGRANNSGARGYNNSALGAVSSPIQVGSNTTWPITKSKSYRLSAASVSVGAIKTDGTLWTWGKAGAGQLGQNNTPASRSSPTQVGTQTDWDSIYINGAASHGHVQSSQATTKSATPG